MRKSPRDFLHLRLGEQIEDLRFLRLAVAIHAPVALLKDHQRPWQVKMDEAVAEVVEIQALRRHVRTEQQPQGILQTPEALDDLLLRGIRELAVHERDLLVAQVQIALQLTMQPAQGLKALGEHHHTVCCIAHGPPRLGGLQVRQQPLILAEIVGIDAAQRGGEVL